MLHRPHLVIADRDRVTNLHELGHGLRLVVSGQRQALVRRALRGDRIRLADWDAMWAFYQDTGSRKWGRPYLTRDFFDLVG